MASLCGEEGRGGRVGVYERECVFVKEGEKQVSCVNEKAFVSVYACTLACELCVQVSKYPYCVCFTGPVCCDIFITYNVIHICIFSHQ